MYDSNWSFDTNRIPAGGSVLLFLFWRLHYTNLDRVRVDVP